MWVQLFVLLRCDFTALKEFLWSKVQLHPRLHLCHTCRLKRFRGFSWHWWRWDPFLLEFCIKCSKKRASLVGISVCVGTSASENRADMIDCPMPSSILLYCSTCWLSVLHNEPFSFMRSSSIRLRPEHTVHIPFRFTHLKLVIKFMCMV